MVAILLSAHLSFAQLSFYTQNGSQKITEGQCGMTDLKLTVPIPSNALNYEKMQVEVKVAPNAEYQSLAVYYVTIPKGNLNGKKSIDLWMKKDGQPSDFLMGGQSRSDIIDWPCDKKDRSEQFWKLSFKVLGMEVTGYEWQNDINGNAVKVPLYNYVLLKNYPNAFTMDYGKVEEGYLSASGKFMVKRFPAETTQIFDGQKDFFSDKKCVDELVIHYDEEQSNNHYIKCGIRMYDQSVMSEQQAKDDIINALKLFANQYNSAAKNKIAQPSDNFTNSLFNVDVFYPPFVIGPGKSGNKEFDTKVKELSKQDVQWIEKQIGNLKMQFIELDVYVKGEFWRDQSYKAYVEKDHQEHPRKLMVFIGTKGQYTFIGAIYKYGNKPELTSGEQQFIDDIFASFQAL